MAKIYAVANMKGGVGKTTTALAIAHCLIKRKKKVLFIDTDPQRNSTAIYGAKTEGVDTLYDIFFRAGATAKECIQHTEQGDIIASDDMLQSADTKVEPSPVMYKYLKRAVESVRDEYDYIIIDTPPRSGILLGNVLMVAENLIIPITSDFFSTQGIMDFYSTVQMFQEENKNLKIHGLLRIKYKKGHLLDRSVDDGVLPTIAEKMNTRIFDETIRESIKCREAQVVRQSLYEYAPNSTTARDYENFVENEILKEA